MSNRSHLWWPVANPDQSKDTAVPAQVNSEVFSWVDLDLFSRCNDLLSSWAVGNWRIAPARRVRVGFRKFSREKLCIARAQRARAGLTVLPSLSDVRTLSFRWIKPFWYFCLQTKYKTRLALYCVFKQKYQKGFIHRKLRVRTSVILSQPRI